MPPDELASHVRAVRAFNRFYTRQLGLLQERLVDSPFTLSEARILHEIAVARGTPLTATELTRLVGLDAGQLSRILGGFERDGLILREPAPGDRRSRLLTLTEEGKEAYAALRSASKGQIETLLEPIPPDEQRRLVGAMGTIRSVLEEDDASAPWLLRQHRPGDLGWIVHRHGVLYHREQGRGDRFEGLVARIVADFMANRDPERERCWIAERDGENVGSVMLVRHPRRERIARLRLLLVEPSAGGLGIGSRLVEECTRFARAAGYRGITLWTDRLLLPARRVYEREGYRRVRSTPHQDYGSGLVAEDWELEL